MRKGVISMTTCTQYKSFTTDTVIPFAKEHGWFAEEDVISAKEIGDGNLNYVFRLENEKGKSIIIKQSLPYAKVVGESWPLTLKRATIEAEALKKHGTLAPSLVPEVYYTDETLAITVMEDLSHLTIARDGLVKGHVYPKLATDLGVYLAKTLYGTSDFGLHPFEKKRLQAAFSNPELCKITEDLIFTDPYVDAETNDFEEALRENVESLWQDEVLKLAVAKLKYTFLTKGEALVHGDLHTGSVFVDESETKVIDPEFAFYGPMGFDIGQVVANLLFQYFTRTGEAQQQIAIDIHTVWTTFEQQFNVQWRTKNESTHANIAQFYDVVLADIWADTVGFAGAELIRRTIGLAHVKDLDSIADDRVRIATKKRVLAAGRELIVRRQQIATVDALFDAVVGERVV